MVNMTPTDSSWMYLIKDENNSYQILDANMTREQWGRNRESADWNEMLDKECDSTAEFSWSSKEDPAIQQVLEWPPPYARPFSVWWECYNGWVNLPGPASYPPARVITLPVLPRFDPNEDQPLDSQGNQHGQFSAIGTAETDRNRRPGISYDLNSHLSPMMASNLDREYPSGVVVSIGSSSFTAYQPAGQSRVVHIGSTALYVDGPAYYTANHQIKLTTGGIIVDGSTPFPFSAITASSSSNDGTQTLGAESRESSPLLNDGRKQSSARNAYAHADDEAALYGATTQPLNPVRTDKSWETPTSSEFSKSGLDPTSSRVKAGKPSEGHVTSTAMWRVSTSFAIVLGMLILVL
jgi:hypothetical protein